MFTPITYRGYNYDINTGLYYLQTRYYNPSYGRFLNADTTEILERTKGTVLGANIFAYCNNNPVMNVDYTGELGIITKTIIVVIILFILIKAALYGVKGSDVAQEAIDSINSQSDETGLIATTIWEVFFGG